MLLRLLKRFVLIVICLWLVLFQFGFDQSESNLMDNSDYVQNESDLVNNTVEIPKEEVISNSSESSVVAVSIPSVVDIILSSKLVPVNPLNITISKIKVDHPISEYTNAMVKESGGIVDPSSWNSVDWWSGGGKPGATLNNTPDVEGQLDFTTYLYGHATNNKRRKVVFDDIDLLKSGIEVIIDTELGQFVYMVDEVIIVKKTELMSDSRVVEDTPGRLILISCWSSPSESGFTTKNVVVITSLVNYLPNTD